MKREILTLVLLLIAIAVFAQNPIAMGQTQLNAGFGLSGWGVPVYLGFDYGVHQDITVGGEVSYRSFRENDDGVKYDHSVFVLSGNGNFHFTRVLNLPHDWDFYAGLNIGYYNWSSPSDYPGDHRSGLDLQMQVGGRYYFSPKTAFNLEFGGGNAFNGGKFGLSVKL